MSVGNWVITQSGQKVIVYQDPITEKLPEGEATLIQQLLNARPGMMAEGLES